MRAVTSLSLVHAWIPCLLSVIINTPNEAIPSNSYGKYRYINDEKVAEGDNIKNNTLKTIHDASSTDHQSDYNSNNISETSSRSGVNQSENYSNQTNDTSSSDHQSDNDPDETTNTTSSDHQSDSNSKDTNDASSSSSDHQSEHDSNHVNDVSSSGHQSDYDSNEVVKDADLTVFINLDDSYEDDADNETTLIEVITSKPNETVLDNFQNNNIFNTLNETSQQKPVKDESLKESTRSEISYQKYQVTYVPVKYYPTAPTVPVPTKTFDLSINSETSFNKLFLSRFQLQFSRAPPADKVIKNNNNNGNINYYNSYFGNNHFKVPSFLRIPSIVADRIKKKGAAFFGGLAGFYNA